MSVDIDPAFAPAAQPQEVGRCPVAHAPALRKTARIIETGQPLVERDDQGVWHVRGYQAARAIMRGVGTKQAGFRAELLDSLPSRMNRPILYQEGPPHQQQRKQTARFFTPRATSENYRELMERLSEECVDQLLRKGRADLSALSMRLAVRVAAQVVGMTNSALPGLDRRLDAFFTDDIERPRLTPRSLFHFLRTQLRVVSFFYLDVKPAIRARRKNPGEDVISYLIAQGYSDTEILTECVTYGAAGMATTREFISIAAWHMLEQPALRERFLAGNEEERYLLLQEILRVEPVVGHLYRRATADIALDKEDAGVTIPRGALIDLHIYAINADASVTGEQPLAICPGRAMLDERTPAPVMSFGDGAHRCPGAYIAIQESDIFLRRLLSLDGLRIVREPAITWSELTAGYEVRDFVVEVGGA
jgi:cytochrome P450